MKILYKGKTSTYIGECECETIVLAKKSEVDFYTYSVRCPECGNIIAVYEDGTETAKNIQRNLKIKQMEQMERICSIDYSTQ